MSYYLERQEYGKWDLFDGCTSNTDPGLSYRTFNDAQASLESYVEDFGYDAHTLRITRHGKPVTGPEWVIITRHQSLVQYILDKGIAPIGTPVIPHGGANDVRDKAVIGVLPMHLACLAESVTVIPLDCPFERRGIELTLEQVQQYAGEPQTYTVRKVRR